MRISDLKRLITNFEQEGWVDNVPDMGDLRLHVRGLGNAKYRAMQERLTNAVPRHLRRMGQVTTEASERILGESLAGACLLGWDGLTDENDQPLPFSEEKARELLTDPEMAPLRDAVMWAAAYVTQPTQS